MSWKALRSAALAAALVAPAALAPAAARLPEAAPGLEALDNAGLKSIAAWLKHSGKGGWLGADVADAAGIPRYKAEEGLEVSQRGFRSGDVIRVAQISSDAKRQFILFMAQHPGGEVFFYVSTPEDGLKKAFVSVPSQAAVVPLRGEEARAGFQRELSFWEARSASL
jgi:hypothetical protein